jgi:hypothetical protein
MESINSQLSVSDLGITGDFMLEQPSKKSDFISVRYDILIVGVIDLLVAAYFTYQIQLGKPDYSLARVLHGFLEGIILIGCWLLLRERKRIAVWGLLLTVALNVAYLLYEPQSLVRGSYMLTIAYGLYVSWWLIRHRVLS